MICDVFISALVRSSLYSAAAVSYTLVFGVLGLINFAHGELMSVGAFAGLFFCFFVSDGLITSFLVSAAVGAVLGALCELCVYRPLKNAESIYAMSAAVGMSLALQYFLALLFGTQPYTYPQISFDMRTVAVISSAVLCALVCIFITKTPYGRNMRCVSSDRLAAKLCGIDENRVRLTAFLIGGGTAGVCGVLLGRLYFTGPFMGSVPCLKAFCASVIGGVGNIWGAVLGGLLIGVSETLLSATLGSAYRDGAAAVLMAVFLLIFRRKNGVSRA